MNTIYTHDLSPWLVKLEVAGRTIGIRWYGFAYVLAFVLVFLFFRWAQDRDLIPGFTDEVLEHLMAAVVLGVLVGGRLGFVVQHPAEVLADPLYVVRVWEGGMAFFGGLVGVILGVLTVARRHGLPFLAITDFGAFPAALGLAFGRIANFINAELVGRPTGADWGVIFPNVDNLPRHPSQLYESASHFLLFAILALAVRLRPDWLRHRHGRLSAIFLAGYGFLRVVTDFYRAADDMLGPLSAGQWASLLVGIIGLAWLLWLRSQGRRAAMAP